ncbi:MAG: low-specificity L-threonine aldolase [Desulfobacterales bacterium]|nr:MAG: low-specificity L-threonine aldolase [Desulfobacterales bacterium]UCD90080.1 MAG: low-specificity L-threonine aldolase [Desulfobacterales bacterium]
MRMIDLRSDTITQPTPAMRRAMANAEVGDDVFGEDPTVNLLEETVAERLNKEAALFVASGTMANLVSQLVHCARGDEVILGDQSHIFFYEQGGASVVGGIHPRTVTNQPDGKIDLQDIKTAIRTDDIHFPKTSLILLENTHNRCNGCPIDADYMNAVGKLAKSYGLKIHVDGARLFNAAIAQDVEAHNLVKAADSVSICLSKGLAAPVGSLVCGTREFIKTARRARKIVGGGMRQAGVLAAAGVVAINEMVARLKDDHGNAKTLAKGLAEIDGLSIDPDDVKTNILFFELTRSDITTQMLAEKLNSKGIRLLTSEPNKLRAVTNYHITLNDIDMVLNVVADVLKSL